MNECVLPESNNNKAEIPLSSAESDPAMQRSVAAISLAVQRSAAASAVATEEE